MDQVFIEDLKVNAIIGVNPPERLVPQEVWISVVLFTDQSLAAQSDDIADCVSYSRVADKLAAHTVRAQRFTVEALAADLAGLCLEEPGVKRVRVRVEKPGAVPQARSVGVEIERAR